MLLHHARAVFVLAEIASSHVRNEKRFMVGPLSGTRMRGSRPPGPAALITAKQESGVPMTVLETHFGKETAKGSHAGGI